MFNSKYLVLIQIISIVAFLTESTYAHKLLLINDVHLNLESTENYSEPGTETNMKTLNLVLEQAAKLEAEESEPIEAILLIGDLCKHGMALREDDFDLPLSDTNWEAML